jgi:3-oxoacyl-(acyl-carrier-protein) synthase
MGSAEDIFVHGLGAVSPAGWGVLPLREALAKGQPLAVKDFPRPGWNRPLRVRQVPPPLTRPSFATHARLRRTSPISHYAVAAALEALGTDVARVSDGSIRLGIVLCVMTGCVNYSRRFYDEVLTDPATASPLVFPETVFNAPGSHLAALLGTTAINYTLVGDPGTFLQGLALAAAWLLSERVDGCLVVGAEELDWLTADACRIFARKVIPSDGAGVLYLRSNPATARIHSITGAHVFTRKQSRLVAARQARAELPRGQPGHLLCDGTQKLGQADQAENAAWHDWPGERLSPKNTLGEGLVAASAWQCIAAVDAVQQGRCAAATVSVVGCNQQAIGAHFDCPQRALSPTT